MVGGGLVWLKGKNYLLCTINTCKSNQLAAAVVSYNPTGSCVAAAAAAAAAT